PGSVSILHLPSSERPRPFRNRSVPARRDCLHFGPMYFAMTLKTLWNCYTRRFFGGRQPLCGMGVTSIIEVTRKPEPFSERTAASRPGPGPLTRTSRFLTPYCAAPSPARSAATWAANGVLLREPRKPQLPDVHQDKTLPCRSEIVMMVLLNVAYTKAMPSVTFARARALRVRVAELLPAVAILFYLNYLMQ